MASDRSGLSSLVGQIGRLNDAVMFSHTLFSLPFVLAAILLASDGRPDWPKLVLIMLAAVGARNAANAFNRIADLPFDAANPRTVGRSLPSGRVSRRQLGVYTVAMTALFIGATAFINLLCLALVPVALAFIFAYSYTKRFTWLCHFILGFTCSMATMGGFLAISGHFELRYFILMGSVALWVAGFDIIYARQDIEFDRAKRLHSVPARFGGGLATWVARACHFATLAGFVLLPLFWPLGLFYLVGWLLVAGLLIAEQIVAGGRTERHIHLASYGINQIVAVVFLVAVAADVWVGPLVFPAAMLPDLVPEWWRRLFTSDLLSPGFWQTLSGVFHGQ